MRVFMLWLGAVAIVNLWSSSSIAFAADDYPTMVKFWSTVEPLSIFAKCRPGGDPGVIDCELSETRVKRKADSTKLKNDLAQIEKEEIKPAEKKMCDEFQTSLANLKAGKPIRPNDFFFAYRSSKKQQMKENVEWVEAAYIALCVDPTRESVKKLIRIANDIGSRTCRISYWGPVSQTFSKSFYTQKWESVGKPVGECGTIEYSYFERPKDFNSKDKLQSSYWRFVKTNKVTNKIGKEITGENCADVDESEHLFVWNSEPYYERCDYIELE